MAECHRFCTFEFKICRTLNVLQNVKMLQNWKCRTFNVLRILNINVQNLWHSAKNGVYLSLAEPPWMHFFVLIVISVWITRSLYTFLGQNRSSIQRIPNQLTKLYSRAAVELSQLVWISLYIFTKFINSQIMIEDYKVKDSIQIQNCAKRLIDSVCWQFSTMVEESLWLFMLALF